LQLLGSFFPDRAIFTSDLSNASALGAALVVNNEKGEAANSSFNASMLGLQQCKTEVDLDLGHYRWHEWMSPHKSDYFK
jgi:hypothetical protein